MEAEILTGEEIAGNIEECRKRICVRWLHCVREQISAARDKDSDYLKNHLPVLVNHLTKVLRNPDSLADTTKIIQLGHEHGRQRSCSSDYRVEDFVMEYDILQATVIEIAGKGCALQPSANRLISKIFNVSAAKTVSDFHDLKSRTSPVRSSELAFQELFDQLPGSYLVLSPELRIVTANRQYLNSTMSQREMIVGKHER